MRSDLNMYLFLEVRPVETKIFVLIMEFHQSFPPGKFCNILHDMIKKCLMGMQIPCEVTVQLENTCMMYLNSMVVLGL